MTPTQPPAEPTMISRADVPTHASARYAKQLLAHLGRKLTFTTDGEVSTAAIGDGIAGIAVGDGVLTLTASGPDEQSVARIEHVLGSHLERFGQRHHLTVTWTRSVRSSSVDAD